MLFGLEAPSVAIAYLLCILSALLCVAWGLLRWNRDVAGDEEPESEIRHWAEEEDRVEREL